MREQDSHESRKKKKKRKKKREIKCFWDDNRVYKKNKL